LFEYPGKHKEQVLAPSFDWKVRIGQFRQLEEPEVLENNPGAQFTQVL
jgi:hypothetical protein